MGKSARFHFLFCMVFRIKWTLSEGLFINDVITFGGYREYELVRRQFFDARRVWLMTFQCVLVIQSL